MLPSYLADCPAAWRVDELAADRGWTFELDGRARRDLLGAVRAAYVPGKKLFEYRHDEFDFGSAWPVMQRALAQVKQGRGIALVRGLPREGVSEQEFELMTWALGLHSGVARPQGKATHYMSGVRDAGADYRTGTGRGYSSNAELDYHTDTSDIVFLSCYNRAVSGGMSIVASSLAGYRVMHEEFPQLAPWLQEPLAFGRQGEQAPDEGPFVVMPVFDIADGRLCGRWNWNRMTSAQEIAGTPRLAAEHRKALERFDEVVRRPDLAYSTWLEPGDVQIISSHVTLHSRTEFIDHDEAAHKRLLFRLWLAPPDSARLPESWRDLYRSVEPGTVRGGIRGIAYDEERRRWEEGQARAMGMKIS